MALSLVIHAAHPEPRKVALAKDLLAKGGIAFYPTDTVYALGCSLLAKKSVDRLYTLKRMDPHRSLAFLCADLREIATYAIVSNSAYRLMRRVLPGPYTFILEAAPGVPRLLLPGKRRTIGLRVPANPFCQALVSQLGCPILTTSAVPPGHELACTDVEEAKDAWPRGIDLFVDGGRTPGEPSTIVSLLDDQIEVMREGLGPVEGVLL